MNIRVTSFGHHHGPAPEDAHITLDLRTHFRDPHIDPRLRPLTARDKKVLRAVRRTPGIRRLLAATVDQAQAYAQGPAGDQPLYIAVGCSGGRHRAATVGHLLARRLRRRGHTVSTHDRDLYRDVIVRQPA